MNLSFERDICAWVRDRRALDTLMAFQSRVINTGGLYTYMPLNPAHRTYSLKGLTRLMADILVAVDDADEAPGPRKKKRRARGAGLSADEVRRRRVRAATEPQFEVGPVRSVPRRHVMDGLRGAVRGSRIHQEIEATVMLDAGSFARRYPEGINPWSRNLMEDIMKRGMRPFRAEFIVYDRAIGCATQIDLVAVDRDGTLVFIENKTGYGNGAWTKSGGAYWMTPALSRMPNFACTPRNKAIVQITLGAIMAAKMLGLRVGTYRLAVMRIDEHVIEYIPVDDAFMVQEGVALYHHLKAVRQRPPPPPPRDRDGNDTL